MSKNGMMIFGLIALIGWPAVAAAADPQLAHAVYFTLNDRTAEAKQQLVKGCKELLSGHPGTVYFAAGVLAEEFDRDVNDRDFDVALLIVFRDKAAHDVYQTSPRHEKFIEQYKDLWQTVRVFDSYQQPAAGEPAVRPKRGLGAKRAG
jgi:quinol monooxygenase YgiN